MNIDSSQFTNIVGAITEFEGGQAGATVTLVMAQLTEQYNCLAEMPVGAFKQDEVALGSKDAVDSEECADFLMPRLSTSPHQSRIHLLRF